MQEQVVYDVPETVPDGTVLRILPKTTDESFYWERVDRNIGWVTTEEQRAIRGLTIGIAGVGGMGGLLAQVMLRLGVGEIRIADPEIFDRSNINRQLGAMTQTIGKSKAMETARILRDTVDDTPVVVFPEGINAQTVDAFVDGCDLIFDEVEVFAISPYVLLHQTARRHGVPLFDGLVIGWGTNLFWYPPDGTPVETMLGFKGSTPEAVMEEVRSLEKKIRRDATGTARDDLCKRILDAFVPNLPAYTADATDQQVVLERFRNGQASIFATVPPFAAAVAGTRAVLYLLAQHGASTRNTVRVLPSAPSFLSIDLATLEARVIWRTAIRKQEWW